MRWLVHVRGGWYISEVPRYLASGAERCIALARLARHGEVRTGCPCVAAAEPASFRLRTRYGECRVQASKQQRAGTSAPPALSSGRAGERVAMLEWPRCRPALRNARTRRGKVRRGRGVAETAAQAEWRAAAGVRDAGVRDAAHVPHAEGRVAGRGGWVAKGAARPEEKTCRRRNTEGGGPAPCPAANKAPSRLGLGLRLG